MLIYDDTFTDVMTATQHEATALGAHVYGSEQVLLGLLATGGPIGDRVSAAVPSLSYDAVLDAVERAADDAPLVASLGLSTVAAQVAEAPRPSRTPRNRHTSELQSALNTASAGWGRLRKNGSLPKENKLTSTVLWLAVLEPAARTSRLLQALDVDVDQVRAEVLAAAATPGAPVSTWPTEVRTGPVTRLVQRIFSRTSTAG